MPSLPPLKSTQAALDLIESCTRVIRNVLLALVLLEALLLSSPLLSPRGCRVSEMNRPLEVRVKGAIGRGLPENSPTSSAHSW
jgi:hypothetical protein